MGRVLEAVEADLASMPDKVARSGLAATALAMAERIDEGRGSPSECGKVLIQALEQLRQLAPPEREKDGLDDLASKRAERRARVAGGLAAPADSPSP